MPSLGADMTEATLLEWHVGTGDEVHRGDIIATVDTSKSAIDVESFQDGRVESLLVDPGTTIAVGTPIVRLGSGDIRGVAAGHVSPLARRRARELGVDLAAVAPSRPGGVIGVADVEAQAGTPMTVPMATVPMATVPAVPVSAPEPAPGTSPPGGPALPAERPGMREAIGALMARSKREIPHYYVQSTIDIEGPLRWLEERNTRVPVGERILPAALMVWAAAQAAREVPEVNGHFNGAFTPAASVHLGVAISLRESGVIAPALHDAGEQPLEELMRRLRDLTSRARSGRLRASEMSDPTMTVTMLGEQGAQVVHGIIYPPQVALVGLGTIMARPWAVDGMLTVRRVVTACLAADHRVTDGHRGSQYLAALERALQGVEQS